MPRKAQAPESATEWQASPDYLHVAECVGRNIRRLRKARGWTLDQASERIDLDIAHLTRIERGLLNPTLWTIHRIARGLGVPTSSLLLEEAPGATGATARTPRVRAPRAPTPRKSTR